AKKVGNLILWQDLRSADFNYEEGSRYLIGVPQAYTLKKINDDAFAIKIEDAEVAILNVQKSTCNTVVFANGKTWPAEDYCLQLSVDSNSAAEILELPIQFLP
ncbi:MAG: hypothetical protein Q4G02_02255, partial [bacterium]|nr:hypothetical protein [bacterium]